MLKSGDLPFSAQHGEEKTTMNEDNLKEALDKLSDEQLTQILDLIDALASSQSGQSQSADCREKA